jgi:hypothetical protein
MRIYLNTSPEDMDYLSPTPLITCFTLQGSVIKRNLIYTINFRSMQILQQERSL